MSDHPTSDLDTTIHQPTRLGILTVLSEAVSADFNYLQTTLGLTSGNLSRHLAVLEEAGLVAVRKTFEGRKPRTWLTLTKQGRKRLDEELTALRHLLDLVGYENGEDL